LNSAVYACFGSFIVSPFMVTAVIRHPWQTKFRGKRNCPMIFSAVHRFRAMLPPFVSRKS
jgi:hypothetical protein